MPVNVKSVYDLPKSGGGLKILVTTYWPRGIKKEKIDRWEKELGTPPDLIKKWKGGSINWAAFSKEYVAAMKKEKEKIAELAELAGKQDITLVCTCRDDNRCHRILLKKLIEKKIRR